LLWEKVAVCGGVVVLLALYWGGCMKLTKR
jgi:hypothetical protein